MTNNRLDAATTTDLSGQDEYEIDSLSETKTTTYTPVWKKWFDYYLAVPELQSVIDKKSMWTVGQGFSTDEKTRKQLEFIRGIGQDTFQSIMYNTVRTFTICGDSFAEIIKNRRGELRNLKPILPDSIEIHTNKSGRIVRYVQNSQDGLKKIAFTPNQILHISHNRIADEAHGHSTIEKLETILKMRSEAMEDLSIVFHRYAKPLWIFSVDTDDTTEITKFKAKVDVAVSKSENLVIPKDTVSNVERLSIPQFSSLDPLPWLQLLQKYFIMSEGVPEVILGTSGETSEATSKIVYLAFEQLIDWNQAFLEAQLKSQLGIDLKFKSPPRIENQLKTNEEKSRSIGNFQNKIEK